MTTRVVDAGRAGVHTSLAMKTGFATMLKVLGGELEAAITRANERPTRPNMLRVASIRREIERVRRGEL